jgi:hypothetical protein
MEISRFPITVAKARFLQAWLAHREIGLLDGGHERCSSSLI